MPTQVARDAFVIRPPAGLLQAHPELKRLAADLALSYVYHEQVDDDRLRQIGTALWQASGDPDTLDRQLEDALLAAGLAVLPIVIETADPGLLQLPWETLHHPRHGFLAREPRFALSRRTAAPSPPAAPAEPGPLRVLLFTSLPDDLHPEHGRLDTESEQAAVQEALAPWVTEGWIDLKIPNDGRFATFQSALRDFAPHLVYLSGHGQFRSEPLDDGPGQGLFVFEGPAGESAPIAEAEIGAAFIGTPVQCVVLSACESGKAASDALNSGLARRLAQAGVPHVIGMRESVFDHAAIQFARAFFGAVSRQERVDLALQTARAAVARPLTDDYRPGTVDPGTVDAALAELSLRQWCLPMLLSPNPAQRLILWAFEPRPPAPRAANRSLGPIALPPLFVGRRRELRALQAGLAAGRRRKLLITGPGGQGKTALAGKLAADLEQAGWTVLAWSARAGNRWADFCSGLVVGLPPAMAERYKNETPKSEDESSRAHRLLRLLLEQHGGRVLLLLDNLESWQDPATLALGLPGSSGDSRGEGSELPEHGEAPAALAAWISAAQGLHDQCLTLILTSRWRLPDWPESDHWPLDHASLGDFIRQAQELRLPAAFYRPPDRLRRAHRVLHGNPRGLQFFAAAVRDLASTEEDAFLERLAAAGAELQTDMALDLVIAHRTDAERALLRRLPAYRTPVPIEGIVKLGLDLTEPRRLLEGLLAVSLVEQRDAPDLLTNEYQCPALVAEWLARQPEAELKPTWLEAAADFQFYLFRTARQTIGQAVAVHEALHTAGQRDEADRWVLDRIVDPMNRAGLYGSLLQDWLPSICQSAEPALRAAALNQVGKQHLGTGHYQTALGYLRDALAIFEQIGDRSGEGATLNNISQVYKANGDLDGALAYLVRSRAVYNEIGDRTGQATALNNISIIHQIRGEVDEAMNCLERSRIIRHEIRDRVGEGKTLSNIALVYDARGEPGRALDYLEGSHAIQLQTGDRAGEAIALSNIAVLHQARGNLHRALDYLNRGLKIQQEIGARSGEGATLNNIGEIYRIRRDLGRALNTLQRSLSIRQETGDRLGEGVTLNNISLIYLDRGELNRALDFAERSLAIRQEIGDRAGEAATINNIGEIYRARGELSRALGYFERSLVIHQKIGDSAGEGNTLNSISQIYHTDGDLGLALDYLNRALSIQEQIDDVAGLCATRFNIGRIHWANEERLEALEVWASVYRQAQSIGLAETLQALAGLAPRIGLPNGLASWESLARQIESGERIELSPPRKPGRLCAALSRLLGRIDRRT